MLVSLSRVLIESDLDFTADQKASREKTVYAGALDWDDGRRIEERAEWTHDSYEN